MSEIEDFNHGMTLKDLRKRMHLSQAKVAETINVHYQQISDWERGKTVLKLTVSQYLILFDLYEVEASELAQAEKNSFS